LNLPLSFTLKVAFAFLQRGQRFDLHADGQFEKIFFPLHFFSLAKPVKLAMAAQLTVTPFNSKFPSKSSQPQKLQDKGHLF